MPKNPHQPRPNLPGSGLFMQAWMKKFSATLAEWTYLNFLATSAINEVVDAIRMSRQKNGSFAEYPEYLTDEQRYRLREYDACANLQQRIRDDVGMEQDCRDDTVIQQDKYDCIEICEPFRDWLALMHLACISADPKLRAQKKTDKAPHKRREYLAIVEATEGCVNLMARIDCELRANIVTYRESPAEYTALQPGRWWENVKVYEGKAGLKEMMAEHEKREKESDEELTKQDGLRAADKKKRPKKKTKRG